jgi:hypothetical protein
MQNSPFNLEIDKVDKASWDQLVTEFDDATIYQTWDYAAVLRGADNISHLILKRNNEVLGCCQVTFRRLPVLNLGIADIKWGPLWRKRGSQLDPDIFLHLVRELKREYGIKRHYHLRMWPDATGDWKESVKGMLNNEGFKHNPKTVTHRTLRLDLSPSIEDLRKNFLQKWRNHLNKAEKSDLSVVEGTEDKLYNNFLELSEEMIERKRFTPGVDYNQYRRIQQNLPEPIKMRIAVCEANHKPISTAICSAIGDTGIYILGATGYAGKGLNGAYLLQWRLIQWLKERGTRWYDLGGIDPQSNPGVYEFKLGIAGKTGREEELLGEYCGSFSRQATMVDAIMAASKLLRQKPRAMISINRH